MDLRKMQDMVFDNKKVLVRVDFNVAIADGKVQEKFKLEACKKTIEYFLYGKGVKITLMSHFGRPTAVKTLANPDEEVNPEFSLRQLVGELEKICGQKIVFVPDCIGLSVRLAVEKQRPNEILLLENVRFYDEEEKNDPEFAKRLAENFDVFVNDAFSVCHRNQASVTGITKFLPSYAGLYLQKEIENLDRVMNKPEQPATAIIGGAKIETKLPLINKLENIYSNILVGGKIANEAIDQNIKFGGKVILPVDFAENRLDIGPKTIAKFKEIITDSKVIVWNGPMGKFEEPPYGTGTREILGAVVASEAFSLIGGGESIQVLEENGFLDKVSFVSTGGGAMLEYLSGNPMPGIEVLKNEK